MTYGELVATIQRLSLDDRRLLIEILTRSVRDDLTPRPVGDVPVEAVRGLLRPDGPPPSDAELAEAYTEYLLKKYA